MYFKFLMLSLGFIVVPQIIGNNLGNSKGENPKFMDVVESLITGQGWIDENTTMFYGQYGFPNETLQIPNDYSMSGAYFYTNLIIFVGTLLYISVTTAKLYSKNFIQAQASDPFAFLNIIYAGWDFAIREPKYAKLNHSTLKTQLQLLLGVIHELSKGNIDKKANENLKESRSKWTLCTIITINIFFWILSIGSIGGIGYGTYTFLDGQLNITSTASDLDLISNEDGIDWQIMYLSSYVTAVMLVGPTIFKWFGYLAQRLSDGEGAIRIRNLISNVVLAMSLIYYVVYYKIKNSESIECWENSIGQEMYRLLLLFFFAIIILTFLWETAYKLIQPWLTCMNFTPPEFDIAQNTMFLIYGQTLTWVAIYYSPMISLVFNIVLFLTFYIKLASLKLNCSISTKPWHAGQSQTMFSILTFLCQLGAFGLFCYVIQSKTPSTECGPFYNRIHPYDVLDGQIIDIVFKPGVAGCILAALIVILYYLHSQRVARRQQVEALTIKLKHMQKTNQLLKGASNKITFATGTILTRRRSSLLSRNASLRQNQ